MKYEHIGKIIKEARIKEGLTQKELALRIQKTESSIRKYEKGLVIIPLNVLARISEVLKIDIFTLVQDIDRDIVLTLQKAVSPVSPTEKTYVNEQTGAVTHDLAYKQIQTRKPKQDVWETLMDMQKYAYDKSNFYIGLNGQEYKELLEEVTKTINNHAFKVELKRQGKI